MKRFISCITLSLSLAPVSSAIAQWQFSADAGARYVRMAEIGADNRELVREYGWLSGIGLTAAYATQDWQFDLAGEFYRNDITYDGQLQNGTPFASYTETTQRRIRLEVGKRITDAMQLTAAIEQDYWQRNILGRGSVAGMQEEYTSWRLLAGAKHRMTQWSAGAVEVTGAVVFARPEKLRVRFDRRLYDDASLRTKSAVGLRLGLDFQPAALPNLSLATDFDWIRIGRSDNAVLRQNGVPIGFVTQSEHERTAFGLRANYRF